MTPTQLSLRHLTANGYTAAVVEKWNPHTRIRQDLFGFADLFAFHPNGDVLLVQTTTKSNTAARVKKIGENAAATSWKSSGHRIEVHGWFQAKPRAKWEVRITAL